MSTEIQNKIPDSCFSLSTKMNMRFRSAWNFATAFLVALFWMQGDAIALHRKGIIMKFVQSEAYPLASIWDFV